MLATSHFLLHRFVLRGVKITFHFHEASGEVATDEYEARHLEHVEPGVEGERDIKVCTARGTRMESREFTWHKPNVRNNVSGAN